MEAHLCAVKHYKKAFFSKKRTFESMLIVLVTPVDNQQFYVFVLAGELREDLEKAFWAIVVQKGPLQKMQNFFDTQEEYTARNPDHPFVVIESAACKAKKLDIGNFEVKIPKSKYMADFVLEYDQQVSRQAREQVFKLTGDIKVEDFVSDTFQAGKMRQRVALARKVLK